MLWLCGYKVMSWLYGGYVVKCCGYVVITMRKTAEMKEISKTGSANVWEIKNNDISFDQRI